ncbi:hypothetical protein EV401DRAFT_1129440 [Pisolithus croceorrhizus]|nr:hypothetical protein EV401DRAFT_1129440 [Pisolithus croceorrhizus]
MCILSNASGVLLGLGSAFHAKRVHLLSPPSRGHEIDGGRPNYKYFMPYYVTAAITGSPDMLLLDNCLGFLSPARRDCTAHDENTALEDVVISQAISRLPHSVSHAWTFLLCSRQCRRCVMSLVVRCLLRDNPLMGEGLSAQVGCLSRARQQGVPAVHYPISE